MTNFTSLRPALAILCLLMAGCAQSDMFQDPTVDSQMAESEQLSPLLATMPLPKERIAVSVYEFQDQTGQFKPSQNITEYSSAVTKGGLAVLTKALLDAGDRKWFMVAERGGLRNLLQERQIVQTMREQYRAPDGSQIQELPPLVYSGVLLEGGIIFYDSNVLTGGAGAKYFGVGGNTEYRRDLVTVYLRAVSTRTGEVLLSVTSSKTIYSLALNSSLFRYLAIDRLLEMEAGLTVNEPGQLAIRRAVETAVYSLVMEGAEAGLWDFANPNAGATAVKLYQERKMGAVKATSNAKDNNYNHELEIAPKSAPQASAQPAGYVEEPAPAPAPAEPQQQAPAPAPTQAPAPQTPAPQAAAPAFDPHPLPVCNAKGCCVITRWDGSKFKTPACIEKKH